jgi:hypothetical protein
MAATMVRAAILIAAAVLGLAGCAQKSAAVPAPSATAWQVLEDVRQATASATKRSPAAIDVARSEFRVVVAVSAAEEANADIPALQAEAAVIAVALEDLAKRQADLAGIQVLSVAFVHQHGTSGAHTDNVFDFRKQSNGAFKYNAI